MPYTTPEGIRYSLTAHARSRMAQRQITRGAIEDALDNYEISHTDRLGNPCYIKTMASGDRLRVVAQTGSDPLSIITVVNLS